MSISKINKRYVKGLRLASITLFGLYLIGFLNITFVPGLETLLVKQLATVAGGWNRNVDVPTDPSTIARDVIATLASSIELSTSLRQEILEDLEVKSRLDRLLPLLKQGNELMQEKYI